MVETVSKHKHILCGSDVTIKEIGEPAGQVNSSFKMSMIKGGFVNKMTFGKRILNGSREMKNYLNFWMWEMSKKSMITGFWFRQLEEQRTYWDGEDLQKWDRQIL